MKKKNKPQKSQPIFKQNQTDIAGLNINDYSKWFIVIALLLTLIAYIPAFSANFVNWDDPDYVINNLMIRSFSDFGKFFTTTVQGNYHPLTMISLAINYAISGNNAFSYHAFNVLFHLANVFLVYKLISRLSFNNVFIAFTVAILFGVHPMHVESVAWVSERKDVLYSMFFLLGLISYLKYLDQNSRKHFIYTLIWFALSILSKPAAIVFPGVLFALDYYRKRELSISLFLEKIPFLLLSLVLVFLTMKEQTAVGATPLTEVYDFKTRIFFPFYGYMMYIVKMIWPFNLSAFYPFLPLNTALPLSYLISPVVFIAMLFICFKTWKTQREITFGFGFYFINLILVSQIFLFGSAIIADRYTYMPYVGLFFLIGWAIDQKLKLKTLSAYMFIIVLSLIFTFLSFRQASTWKNTASLWDSAINNHPSSKAYKSRAQLFQQEGDVDKAIEYYHKLIAINVNDEGAYHNLGVIYFNQGKDSLSLINFNAALNLKPDYEAALNSRGALYARQGKNDLAYADFDKVGQLNPNFDQAHKNKAGVYFQQNKFDLAIEEYKQYLIINKNDADAYAYLGASFLNTGANEEAIKAFEQVVIINPRNFGAYINLATAHININQYPKAVNYLNTAYELDSTNENNLKALSKAYLSMGDTAKAYSLYETASRLKK